MPSRAGQSYHAGHPLPLEDLPDEPPCVGWPLDVLDCPPVVPPATPATPVVPPATPVPPAAVAPPSLPPPPVRHADDPDDRGRQRRLRDVGEIIEGIWGPRDELDRHCSTSPPGSIVSGQARRPRPPAAPRVGTRRTRFPVELPTTTGTIQSRSYNERPSMSAPVRSDPPRGPPHTRNPREMSAPVHLCPLLSTRGDRLRLPAGPDLRPARPGLSVQPGRPSVVPEAVLSHESGPVGMKVDAPGPSTGSVS